MASRRIRIAGQSDLAEVTRVERMAFEYDRGGEPADDIVAAVCAMAGEEGAFGLTADYGGVVVGHIQFSRAWVGDSPVLLLGPVGVLPAHQGRGIGSALIRTGLEEAKRRGESAVILLGDPRFYDRFGFVPGSSLGLCNPAVGVQPNGFEVREEDFQIVFLTEPPGQVRGTVRWHPSL